MTLGLFYQSGYRIEACYHALKQFRKFYPDAPVALYEDNTNILQPVANKFNCVYKKTDKQGFNDPESGRPAFNIETTVAWLDRVYEACITTLKDVDWVMNMEDDVWFLGKIEDNPPFDLNGIGGRGWQDERLYEYLKTSKRGAHGCGGSTFNRLKFIEAYHNAQDIDWEYIESIAGDGSPTQWTDSMLTFIFMYSKKTVGSWSPIQQFVNYHPIPGKHAWYNPIPELEVQQGNAKVVHCWKPYYFPTQKQKEEITNDLKKYI